MQAWDLVLNTFLKEETFPGPSLAHISLPGIIRTERCRQEGWWALQWCLSQQFNSYIQVPDGSWRLEGPSAVKYLQHWVFRVCIGVLSSQMQLSLYGTLALATKLTERLSAKGNAWLPASSRAAPKVGQTSFILKSLHQATTKWNKCQKCCKLTLHRIQMIITSGSHRKYLSSFAKFLYLITTGLKSLMAHI